MAENHFRIVDELSGPIAGYEAEKFAIVADFIDRQHIDIPETYKAIEKEAAVRGFSGGGLSGPPAISPVDNSGAEIPEDELLDPATHVAGFRAKFRFMRGLGSF